MNSKLEKIIKEYDFFAKNGDKESMLHIGIEAYLSSEEGDLPIAIEWLEKASSLGAGEAMVKLGQLYSNYLGSSGGFVDVTKALIWLDKATQYDDSTIRSEAWEALGQLYSDGTLISKDIKKAFECYVKCYEDGWIQGLIDMSMIYENDDDVREQLEEPLYYWYGGYLKGHESELNKDKYDYEELDAWDDEDYWHNPRILKWWNEDYDQLICRTVVRWKYWWKEILMEKISDFIEKDEVKTWVESDPMILGDNKHHKVGWCELLSRFIEHRAEEIGALLEIKETGAICIVCGMNFNFESIKNETIFPKIMGVDRVNICKHCLYDAGKLKQYNFKGDTRLEFEKGNRKPFQDEIFSMLVKWAYVRGMKYPKKFNLYGNIDFDLPYMEPMMSDERRLLSIKFFQQRNVSRLVEGLYGTWRSAVYATGMTATARSITLTPSFLEWMKSYAKEIEKAILEDKIIMATEYHGSHMLTCG